jgi:hypothetical protein
MKKVWKDRRPAKITDPKLVEFLRSHLRISVSSNTQLFGTPDVEVSLWLDNELISKDTATIYHEHYSDPDW